MCPFTNDNWLISWCHFPIRPSKRSLLYKKCRRPCVYF